MRVIAGIVLFFCSAQVVGQNMYTTARNTYLCISGGPSKFVGDVGGTPNNILDQLTPNSTTWFASASVQRLYKRKLALELTYNFGKVKASDADVKYTSTADPNYAIYRRNLDFQSKISEVSGLISFYPLHIFSRNNSNIKRKKLQPFLFAGLSYYTMNPEGTFYDPAFKNTVWLPLNYFHTEGQGYDEYPASLPYSLQQWAVPHGGGLTYFFTEGFFMSLQLNNRRLFTDYLDDVSGNYIDPAVHASYKNIYFEFDDEVDQAKLLSDKSSLVDPLFSGTPGTPRGNNINRDAFFSYSLKLGVSVARKRNKKATYYKYDDSEKCE